MLLKEIAREALELKSKLFPPLLTNIYASNFSKTALLSYITPPFGKKNVDPKHTNHYESRNLAKALNQLGYVVDVCDFRYGTKGTKHYDVLVGFGETFEHSVHNFSCSKRILYATGMQASVQNTNTFKALERYLNITGKMRPAGLRYVKETWPHQLYLNNAVLSLGNYLAANTFRQLSSSQVYEIPPFPLKKSNSSIQIDLHCAAEFVWFGSNGSIHKGLDLAIELAFRLDKKVNIIGLSPKERFIITDFEEKYGRDEFARRVKVYSYIPIGSKQMKEILRHCKYLVFPTASEGGSPSIISLLERYQLIPIYSKYASVTLPFHFEINPFDLNASEKTLAEAFELNDEETKLGINKNITYIRSHYTLNHHYEAVLAALQETLV